MAVSKKYIHDHMVLLLLSINAFLLAFITIFIIIRLSGGHSSSYIVACRDCSNQKAINRFMTGGEIDLISFIVFSFLVFVGNSALSIRTYVISRQLSMALLGLGVVLQILTLTVSNALLVLR